MIYPQATAPLAVANPLLGTGPGVGVRAPAPSGTSDQIISVTDNGAGLALFETGAAHGLTPAIWISISGTAPTAYDGDWEVLNTPTATTFTTGQAFLGEATGTWAAV